MAPTVRVLSEYVRSSKDMTGVSTWGRGGQYLAVRTWEGRRYFTAPVRNG
ncbi:hypothetical protein AB0N97_40865 [Streptomyces collinus]|uniref:Integrase n=1 Tax=Streptomyces violaceochromogenes TaxID=67377 RepID=A0ABU6LPY9_9ACTN|nr:hypothetical protein [Streptomyces violaceochromogenes]